jgi:hypothetical protein
MFGKLKKLKEGDFLKITLKTGEEISGHIRELDSDHKQIIMDEQVVNFEEILYFQLIQN